MIDSNILCVLDSEVGFGRLSLRCDIVMRGPLNTRVILHYLAPDSFYPQMSKNEPSKSVGHSLSGSLWRVFVL